MVAGIAGVVAAAMSMAAGEYVSVSSQADTEKANIKREKKEQETDPAFELTELANIYVTRGLDQKLAMQVAKQLSAKNASATLAAHVRDELGISESLSARPVQAALASAAAFMVGAVLPLLAAYLVPLANISFAVGVISVGFLMLLGLCAALIGGAPVTRSVLRVTFWGLAAMSVAGFVGSLSQTISN